MSTPEAPSFHQEGLDLSLVFKGQILTAAATGLAGAIASHLGASAEEPMEMVGGALELLFTYSYALRLKRAGHSLAAFLVSQASVVSGGIIGSVVVGASEGAFGWSFVAEGLALVRFFNTPIKNTTDLYQKE